MIIVCKIISLAIALSLVVVAVLPNPALAQENQLELTVNQASLISVRLILVTRSIRSN